MVNSSTPYDPGMDEDEPRDLTFYCANGCGRIATTNMPPRIGPDGFGGALVTAKLVCAECRAREEAPCRR